MEEYIDRLRGSSRAPLPMFACGEERGGECFLIKGRGANILIDSGYGFNAGMVCENVAGKLGGEPLDYIFLTHSHYDHILGSALLKKRYPGAKVISSEYCDTIIRKESARAFMNKMDRAAAEYYGMPPGEDITGGLAVDYTVADGEELVFGGEKAVALALPGHTKCCMGLLFPEKGLLVSCETVGLYAGGEAVMAACVSSCRETLRSIKKLLALDFDAMLVSHSGVFYGNRAYEFLERSLATTEEFRELVLSEYRKGSTAEETVAVIKKRFYDNDSIAPYYPIHAFRANAMAQIPMIIREENDGTEV